MKVDREIVLTEVKQVDCGEAARQKLCIDSWRAATTCTMEAEETKVDRDNVLAELKNVCASICGSPRAMGAGGVPNRERGPQGREGISQALTDKGRKAFSLPQRFRSQ